MRGCADRLQSLPGQSCCPPVKFCRAGPDGRFHLRL